MPLGPRPEDQPPSFEGAEEGREHPPCNKAQMRWEEGDLATPRPRRKTAPRTAAPDPEPGMRFARLVPWRDPRPWRRREGRTGGSHPTACGRASVCRATSPKQGPRGRLLAHLTTPAQVNQLQETGRKGLIRAALPELLSLARSEWEEQSC